MNNALPLQLHCVSFSIPLVGTKPRINIIDMNFTHFLNSPVVTAVVALMVLSFVFLMLYYGLVWFRTGRRRKTAVEDSPIDDRHLPAVSVIMSAHNDAEWLRENLVYLLEQDYPNFEVVVVDYVSHDDSQFVLQLCSENYSHLKVVPFKEDVNMFHGKKYPLSIGIKSAKNDILIFAEPDSVPKDFGWIREVVKGYDSNDKQLVLGYCGVKQENSLLNWLQVYDNLMYNVSFLSAALSGHPYTGSGKNLSYRRSFFFNQGAFISHYNIPWGADDMFVNQNATPKNTSVVLTPASYVQFESQKRFGLWHRVRRHRTATRRYYRPVQKLRLLFHPVSLFLFYATAVALLVTNLFPWQIILGMLAAKFAWQIISVYQLVNKFGVKNIHWVSPIFEFYFLFANTILFFTPLSNKK